MFENISRMAFAFAVFILHFPLSCSGKDMTVSLLTLLFVNGITVALEPDPPDSVCHFSNILKVTIALEWALIVSVFFGVLIVFNPVDEDDVEDSTIIARRFTIRQDAHMRAAMDDLANLMSSFFSDVDIVFSDVLAGLFLVVHSPSNVYPPLIKTDTEPPAWMTVENALHFQHFSSCVYGWPTYLLHNFGIRPAYKLFRKLQCCGRLRCDQKENSDVPMRNISNDSRVHDRSHYKPSTKVLVIEDNCCFCNTAAFTLSNEQKNIDLFFVSFRNELYEVPFVVLADHETRSIVITIRGSCSLVDLVTDLCLDDEVLSVDVDADPLLRTDTTLDAEGEVRVHRGMLMSARYVFDTLRKHQVLEDLAVLNTGYQLVVCGHSLGAGVASLLTLLLKQEYPDVRCFAFAPPGCVISENGLHEMEQHVMGIVAGDDVVSRISFHALQRLRVKVAAELDACTKAKIIPFPLVRRLTNFYEQFNTLIIGYRKGTVTDRLNLIPEGATMNGGSYGTTNAPPNTATAVTISTNQRLASRVELFAPGKLLYIAEDESREDGVACDWIDPKCLSDVKLTASAVTDHLPKNIERMLEKVIAAKGAAVIIPPATANEGSPTAAAASTANAPANNNTSARTTPPRLVVTDQPRTSSR
ncbi:triacylglycerol lipase [Ancylostoma ceylanicum]|uniref:sn-1-specific diacylglycerol lipase n=1 Tax=Ancylostoma ceylanicum TaxID=53326 RepID=A0A0D6LK70_9BILA|nr:triacylglycerol lipase [Ancylostoma ceylanicum]